jgi:outer membrane protein assembly factor BamD
MYTATETNQRILQPQSTHRQITWRSIRAFFSIAIACVALMGCANNEESLEDEFLNSITEAYETAEDAMLAGNYRKAIRIFEALQARFPFSELSKQIQLQLMYAYYKSGSQEQAIDASETFTQENPTHERVDYAMYIKALAYFERDAGILERWFRKDLANRPPQDAELAFSLLKRLVERYPASEYSADAEQRMVYLRNRLAAYENSVADYYLRRGAYVAAVNRAKHALEEYNGAASGKESLDILIAAYEELGMEGVAADARRVRQNTFPNES